MSHAETKYLSVNLNILVGLMQIHAKEILDTKFSISYSEFLILHVVLVLGSPTQQQISNRLSLTGASVSKLTDKLLDANLISKSTNSNNKRANIIHLTQEGNKKITSALDALESEFDLYITKADKKIMSDIADKIICNLIDSK